MVFDQGELSVLYYRDAVSEVRNKKRYLITFRGNLAVVLRRGSFVSGTEEQVRTFIRKERTL